MKSAKSLAEELGVFQRCDCQRVLSARLELKEVFRVVSDIVCVVGGNISTFLENVFWKDLKAVNFL